jgi:hypothetical protein
MGKITPRRIKLAKPSPESLAARASGEAINATRRETLGKVLDTAIRLWFLGHDPFPVHLLICSAYFVLCDLCKGTDKGPRLETKERREMTAAYDFMRHGQTGMIDDSVDLVPSVNQSLLFDAILSFTRVYLGSTVLMETFLAYYVTHRSPLSDDAAKFLPQGITVEECLKLSRIEFLTKVANMFAAQRKK